MDDFLEAMLYLTSWCWVDGHEKWDATAKRIFGSIFFSFFSPLTRNSIFILSCIAVSLDPLFFYIPIIDEKDKCLGIDKNLRTAALIFRALPDATFALRTIISGYTTYTHYKENGEDHYKENGLGTLEHHYKENGLGTLEHTFFCSLLGFAVVLIAVSLILPIPQLAIAVFYFEPGGSGHFGQRVTVNVFLIIYYLARGFLIYMSSMDNMYHAEKWVRAALNLFFYILASHVAGGFWYFFSIQREISCWDQSCRNAIECGPTHYCSDRTSRDITFLNESCPINPQNTTIFNFGIFFDAIQSGSTRSIHFPTKFFYCIWWGIKNLSNFGTNLATSSYVWENCFAVITSITGMLLFFYLLGNVQINMQEAAELRHEIDKRKKDIKIWMENFYMSYDLKKTIMGLISRKLKGKLDGDVDLNFMFNILPENSRHLLHHYFCRWNMEMKEFEMISKYLQPKVFKRNDKVVQAGERLHSILFIISGSMQVSGSTKTFETGMSFGRQLLDWAAETQTFKDAPPSEETVLCSTKVEAFVLDVDDLKNLVENGKLKNYMRSLDNIS